MTQFSMDEALDAAMAHHEAGRLKEAEELYRQILARDADDPEVNYFLGLVLGQSGRYAGAIVQINKALRFMPADADVWNNLGEFYRRNGESAPALAAFREALGLKGDHPEAMCNLGVMLLEEGDVAEAERQFAEALRLKPEMAGAYSNLGRVRWRQDRMEESVALSQQALALNKDDAQAHFNLGAALRGAGKVKEAEAEFRQTVALQREHMEAHLALASICLGRGDFEQGWKEYEWRLVKREYAPLHAAMPEKVWDGSALNGRTILLYAEQGLGDTVHFSRYAALVARMGGRVVLACQRVLMDLLKDIEGVSAVADYFGVLPAFDVHCSLLSLPRLLGTRVETVPAKVPYVRASAAEVARCGELLAGVKGLKVGIAWQGNPKNPNDVRRSVPLELFEAVARVEGVTLVSLQRGVGEERMAAVVGRVPVVDVAAQVAGMGAFGGTPALIGNLDLVISVDSVVCHVAGAMGAAVWTLIPFVPDWRWMESREDCLWYPTMRLFRQRVRGDWAEVMGRVAGALAERARMANVK